MYGHDQWYGQRWGGVVAGVEISVDGGTTLAVGYRYDQLVPQLDASLGRSIQHPVRAYDDSGNMGTIGVSGTSSNINVGGQPHCPLPIRCLLPTMLRPAHAMMPSRLKWG